MKRVQKVGEPFDTFATDLRNLIQTCEYHVEERENLLRDQIVLGISSDSVREKLFYADDGEAKLTLPIAVDICKNSEMTVYLMQNVSVDASVHVPVQAMKSSVKSSKQKVKPKYSGRPGAQWLLIILSRTEGLMDGINKRYIGDHGMAGLKLPKLCVWPVLTTKVTKKWPLIIISRTDIKPMQNN